MSKGKILSGMRPTGKLHIGHLSVLENWAKLQYEYECYFAVADWHALTTSFEDTASVKENVKELVISWLSVGLDPEKSVIFVQSDVKEHAELHLLFSMITPLPWLERVPTYKDQVVQLGKQGKDIATYGFLGYPLLQAADILVYKADAVPVGEDQLPHLELTREVARRFNFMYQTELFPEPQPILAEISLLPGVDGRKMSKSYANDIAINSSEEEIWQKVNAMVTDPQRIKKTDPGNPEVCVVYKYKGIYHPDIIAETEKSCRGGEIGCVACKRHLAEAINSVLAPIRERRKQIEADPGLVERILKDGADRARQTANKTMEEVKAAMKI